MTWDGNAYRKTTVFMLRQGYNPIYETFYDAVARIGIIENRSWEPWLDGYPKGSEIFATVIYAITGNIESGKCFNALLVVAAFFIAVDVFVQLFNIKLWQSAICAAALCINPVTLAQVQTFYNDGSLGMLLFICILSLLYLTLKNGGGLCKKSHIMIFASMALGFSNKFSALIYFAIFTAAFYIYWVIRDFSANRWKRLTLGVLKQTVFLAVCVTASVLVFGFTPYVVNVFRFGNPFYPLIGEGAVDILTINTPEIIRYSSRTDQFLHSLLAVSSNNSELGLKVPFTLSGVEINGSVDLRLGGWGIYFSGIFAIACLILISFIVFSYKRNREYCFTVLILIAAVLAPIPFVPALFWARYNVQLFILPVMALIVLFVNFNKKPMIFLILPICLSMLFMQNITQYRGHIWRQLRSSTAIRYEFWTLKKLSEYYPLQVSVKAPYGSEFYGLIANLKDAGITNYQINNDLEEWDGTMYNTFLIRYKIIFD